AGLRGAELQPVGHDVRSWLARRGLLLRGCPGDRATGCAAGWRRRMKNRRGGLGRGLGALIPTAPPAEPSQVATAPAAVIPRPATNGTDHGAHHTAEDADADAVADDR